MSKIVQETKCTCRACGNIWYYGKAEALEQAGKQMRQLGKSMACCTGCAPAAFLPNQQVKDLNKCPKCNSGAVDKQIVRHTVE